MIISEFKIDMREKLRVVKSEFADSDMLIDFVLVMLENRKPKEYVISQLMDCKLGLISSNAGRGSKDASRLAL